VSRIEQRLAKLETDFPEHDWLDSVPLEQIKLEHTRLLEVRRLEGLGLDVPFELRRPLIRPVNFDPDHILTKPLESATDDEVLHEYHRLSVARGYAPK
jgi:hypothetical protein